MRETGDGYLSAQPVMRSGIMTELWETEDDPLSSADREPSPVSNSR